MRMPQEASGLTLQATREVTRSTFERHGTRTRAILHCRSRFQSIIIRDVSRSGIKLENAAGLIPGDAVTIELLSHRNLRGKVAWSVASFAGVVFDSPLPEHDPLLTCLLYTSDAADE